MFAIWPIIVIAVATMFGDVIGGGLDKLIDNDSVVLLPVQCFLLVLVMIIMFSVLISPIGLIALWIMAIMDEHAGKRKGHSQ